MSMGRYNDDGEPGGRDWEDEAPPADLTLQPDLMFLARAVTILLERGSLDAPSRAKAQEIVARRAHWETPPPATLPEYWNPDQLVRHRERYTLQQINRRAGAVTLS